MKWITEYKPNEQKYSERNMIKEKRKSKNKTKQKTRSQEITLGYNRQYNTVKKKAQGLKS